MPVRCTRNHVDNEEVGEGKDVGLLPGGFLANHANLVSDGRGPRCSHSEDGMRPSA